MTEECRAGQARAHEGPKVIAVAGAKGGTGKSMIAANIGVFLATLGKRVVLIDAAFGAATLHSFVGASEPSRTLADFLARKEAKLDEILVRHPDNRTCVW